MAERTFTSSLEWSVPACTTFRMLPSRHPQPRHRYPAYSRAVASLRRRCHGFRAASSRAADRKRQVEEQRADGGVVRILLDHALAQA